MRLIDVDKMAVDESEAYMSAQVQITDDLKWLVNFAAHSKIQRLIADTPTVDAVPVVLGRWIEKSAPARKIYFECSHCGAQENKHTAIKGYYCWHCGAKMDGSAENG